MEQRYKSLSLFEFQRRFPNDEACLKYLSDLKWSNGYRCKRCGNDKYNKGNTKYHRKCTRCNHQESPTSDTLFHKVKFPILKAFYIVYFVSTSKKGISSTELSRKLQLRQKTCWFFKQKVMRAMKSSQNYPLQGNVEVDETVIGGQESGTRGRKNDKKRLSVFAIEKNGKGISRMYGKEISKSSSSEFRRFFDDHISPEAMIRTDKCTGYKPLKQEYKNLLQEESGQKGKNFPEMHRAIMMFKSWLRGIHHSVTYTQAYIDEYTYRFNRQFMTKGLFENLLKRMVNHEPMDYKKILVT